MLLTLIDMLMDKLFYEAPQVQVIEMEVQAF